MKAPWPQTAGKLLTKSHASGAHGALAAPAWMQFNAVARGPACAHALPVSHKTELSRHALGKACTAHIQIDAGPVKQAAAPDRPVNEVWLSADRRLRKAQEPERSWSTCSRCLGQPARLPTLICDVLALNQRRAAASRYPRHLQRGTPPSNKPIPSALQPLVARPLTNTGPDQHPAAHRGKTRSLCHLSNC